MRYIFRRPSTLRASSLLRLPSVFTEETFTAPGKQLGTTVSYDLPARVLQ